MTGIEWTDKTINPIVGCSPISSGCKNCYAVNIAHRFQSHPKFTGLTHQTKTGVAWTGNINTEMSAFSKIPITPCRIFLGSMTDLFHPNTKENDVRTIFEKIKEYPQHEFQILTKRPSFITKFNQYFEDVSNIWMGATTENQETLDSRWPFLIETPFPVKFLSVEPMLGEISLKNQKILPDWVIIGGESGTSKQTRPFHLEWGIKLIQECQTLEIPVFFKQCGSKPYYQNNSLKLKDSKGGDLEEIPSILNIREFPLT